MFLLQSMRSDLFILRFGTLLTNFITVGVSPRQQCFGERGKPNFLQNNGWEILKDKASSRMMQDGLHRLAIFTLNN